MFEVELAAGRRAGSVWVTLRHHDPLEVPRNWTHSTALDSDTMAGVVGRYGIGFDLLIGPGRGHIAVV